MTPTAAGPSRDPVSDAPPPPPTDAILGQPGRETRGRAATSPAGIIFPISSVCTGVMAAGRRGIVLRTWYVRTTDQWPGTKRTVFADQGPGP